MDKHFENIEKILRNTMEVVVRVREEELLELIKIAEENGYMMFSGQTPYRDFQKLSEETEVGVEIFPIFIDCKRMLYTRGHEKAFSYCENSSSRVQWYDTTQDLLTTEII